MAPSSTPSPNPTPLINDAPCPPDPANHLSCASKKSRPKPSRSPRAKTTMETNSSLLFLFSLLLLVAAPSLAADSDMLQDLCVADLNSAVKVNGFACKANVTENDFFFQGLASPGNTNNTLGIMVMGANVENVPGLNTLGISMARIDSAPGALIPPHTHPRATEMVFVLDGTLDVGFITTGNKLVNKTITKGDTFVFPRGLVHFLKNHGDSQASLIAAFNSQLPGAQSIASTLFAASPPVPDNVLTMAFQIDTEEVQKIKSRFAPKTN